MTELPACDRLGPGAHRLTLPVSQLPDGTPLAIPICVVVGARPGPQVAVTAAVHGDEFEGVCAVAELSRELDPAALRGSVVLVPVANPPAFNAGSRTGPIDGVNLNRVFPGSPDGTLSERLAHALTQQIIRRADALIDLHSGGTRYLFQPMAGFYTLPDNPALSARSRAMAEAFGLELLWELPRRPGVCSYEAMIAGVAAIGLEIGGGGRAEPAHVDLARRGVRQVLAHLGLLEAPAPVAVRQRLWSGDFLLAPASGLFRSAVALNQQVRQGELLYTIIGPDGAVRHRRYAEHDGIVGALRAFAAIQAGEWDVALLRPAD